MVNADMNNIKMIMMLNARLSSSIQRKTEKSWKKENGFMKWSHTMSQKGLTGISNTFGS